MSSSSQRRKAFELEALEPRLLLSADVLSAAAGGHQKLVTPGHGSESGIIADFHQTGHAAGDSTFGQAPDLFADVVDEALPGAPENHSAAAAPAAPAAAETTPDRPVVNNETTAVTQAQPAANTTTFSASATAATRLGTTAVSGQSDHLSEQLTTTLTAANGPPQGENAGSNAVISAFSSNDSTNSLVQSRAASVDTSISGPGRVLAASANYSGDHNFGADGTTTVNLSGTSAGQFDTITVSGNATFGGTLAITLGSGYTPAEGDSFTIITATGITAKFANGTGLFGFGDGSRYFALVQDSGSLKLVVKRFGPNMSFVADTTAGANSVGEFLNNGYFTSVTSVTVAGGLSLGQGVSARGTFTFEQGSAVTADLATGFGKPLSQISDSDLSADIKAQLTSLGITSDGTYINDVGMSVIKISATGAEGFIGENGINLGTSFANQTKSGFLLGSLNLGVVIMTPTWTTTGSFPAMSFAAAKGSAGSVTAIGIGGLMSFSAQSATLKVNIGTRFSPNLDQTVVDFAKSFETSAGANNGTYTVNSQSLDFAGARKTEARLTDATATILGVLDIHGDLDFEVGAQKTVNVQTNIPANLSAQFTDAVLQPLVDAGLTVTKTGGVVTGLSGLVVNTFRLSAINVSGFMGLGNASFNGTTITNGSDLTGFGFTGLNLDLGIFMPASAMISNLGMPDLISVKGHIATAATYGLTSVLEMSASNIDIAINTSARLKIGLLVGDLLSQINPTIDLPKLLLPDLTLPSISLGQIGLPSINLPDFSITGFSLPSITLPNLQVPSINLPAITLPSINLSLAVPTITLPSITLPSITLPNLTLPTIDLSALKGLIPNPSLPSLTLPKLVLPDLIIPSIQLPDIVLTVDFSGLVPKLVFPTINIPTIQLPSLVLPDLDLSAFGLPKLKLPNLAMPSITLPAINLPSIDVAGLAGKAASEVAAWLAAHPLHLPAINLPAIKLPDLTLPNLDLSAFKLYDLIFPTLPSLTLPSLTLPQLTIPTITFPTLQFPNLDLSGLSLPGVAIPSFSIPSFSVPQVTFPSLQLPGLPTVSFDLTKLQLPSIALPSITLPTIALPTLTLPKFDITFPQMPTLKLPDLHLPSISLPSLQLPSLDLPDLTLNLPGIPQIKLPTISLPSISLPTIQLPDLHLPDLKLPDLPAIPDLSNLVGLKLSTFGAPALNYQTSFAGGALTVGSSSFNFDGNQRTTVVVNQLDMRVASALSLTGSFAFEFGPRVKVNVATGLPANLGAAASLIQPLFNDLANEAGLTIGTNFSTISGLEVETMTVGATNVTGFFGYGNPNLHTSLGSQSGLVGLGVTGVNFGLAILKPTLPFKQLPTFTALKATASAFTAYGLGIDLSGTGITLDINRGTPWPANLGSPVVDFTTSFPASGSTPVGFAVRMPGGSPTYLDYNGQTRVGVGIANATINIAGFVTLKGGIRLEMGPTYIVNIATGIPATVGAVLGSIGLDSLANDLSSVAGITIGSNFSTINGLEVGSMTIGGTNISAWIGTNNYDFSQPIANQDVYGFKLDGLSFGMGIFTPNVPVSAANASKLPKFTALTAHADAFTFKGGKDNFATLTGSDLTLNVNTGTQWPGGLGWTPVIDFQSSFETSPGAKNGQFAVPTTTGTPIYLGFDGNARMGATIGKATLQIYNVFYLTGSFSFEKGPVVEVPLVAGVAGGISGVSTEFAGTGNKQVETITLGGTNIHGFFGLSGPYWKDSNNNGIIDRDANGKIIAAEVNSAATGLVIDNLTFGLFFGKPTTPLDPVRYIGLKANAQTVELVGIPGVSASADGIQVELNLSTPTVSIFPVLPVINFSGLAGGQYSVKTGAKDANGKDITVDLAMSGPLIRAQGFLSLNIASSLYITGSVAFELGPTATVNLSDGSSPKTVTTMSVGMAHVNAFIGANGPYWVDSNHNKIVEASEKSSAAIGFEITDFTGGMLVMVSTNPSDLGAYVAMKASVNSFGLVNMPGGITATGTFDIALNFGTAITAAVNFVTSFPATTSPVKPAGYQVKTGDSTTPVLLDFTGPQFAMQLTGTLGIQGAFLLTGTFLIDGSTSGLKVFADATLTIGPSGSYFTIRATGVLIVNGSGIATDLEVTSMLAGSQLQDFAMANVTARVILNTTGAQQTITIPTKYVSKLSTAAQSRLLTDGSGNKYYAVAAGAPRLDGTTAPAGTYVVVKFSTTITLFSTFNLVGDFQLVADSEQFQISAKATLALSLSGTDIFRFAVNGDMIVKSSGAVAANISVTLAAGFTIPSALGLGLSADATYTLQFNTSSSTPIQLGVSPNTISVAPGFRVTATAKMSIAGTPLLLDGVFTFTFGTDKFVVAIAAEIDLFLTKLDVIGVAALFYDAHPGIVFSIQLQQSGGTTATVDVFKQNSSVAFWMRGSFRIDINTTGINRTFTIGSNNFTVSSALAVVAATNLSVNIFGLVLSGGLTITIDSRGFAVDNASLTFDFFGVFTFTVTGYLHVFTSGTDFSFSASASITFLNPNVFGFDGSISVTFGTNGFGGGLNGEFGAFGIKVGAHGSFFIADGYVKITVGISLQITPGFHVHIPMPPFIPDIDFDVPPVIISGDWKYTFGALSTAEPPPAPKLADYVGTNGLRLNLGGDAQYRGVNPANGALYYPAGDESYIITLVGPGSSTGQRVKVSALGYSQEFDNITNIVANNTGAGNAYIAFATDVTATVSINSGVTVTGTNHFVLGGGAGVVYGGSGGDWVDAGPGGGTFYAGTGANSKAVDLYGHLTLRADSYTNYSLTNTSLSYSTSGTAKVVTLGQRDSSGNPVIVNGVEQGVPTIYLNGGTNATLNLSTSWNLPNATFIGQGASSTIVAATPNSFVLTDTSLTNGSGVSVALSNIKVAQLSGTDSNTANTFTITGWTGSGTINGYGGTDTVIAVNDLNFTLSDTSLARSGRGTFTLTSVEVANLTGGASANTFTVSSWTGTANLDGAGGADSYTITFTGAGSGTVNINDTGASGIDTVTINGTPNSDSFAVSGSAVTLASETVNYTGAESLTVNGLASADTFAVNSTSIATTLNGDAGDDTFTVVTNSAVLTLNGGADNDNFHIRALGADASIDTGAGTNVVHVGTTDLPASGNVNAIAGKLTIVGNGTDTVNVNDTGDTAANTGQLTSSRLTGLGMGDDTKGIDYSSIETLVVSLGSGGNTFNIRSTNAGTVTTLNTGTGSSTVNVGSAAPGTGGNANGMGGRLNVVGQGANDILNVDDTGDNTANTGTLTNNLLTGLGMGDATKGIQYTTVETLNISLGSGGNTLNIQSTFADTLTTVNTGASTIANVVNIGSLAPITLNDIAGKLIINGQSSLDTVNLNDTGDSAANTGEVTSTRVTGLGMGDATKGLQYSSIEFLNVNLGTGADTLNVLSTNGGTLTTINTGTGSAANVINLGSLAPATGGNVNALAGKIVISGQSTNDTVNVDDRGDTAGNTGNLTTTRLTGLGMAGDDASKGVEYTGIETLNISLGSGGDNFTIQSTHAGVTVLNTLGGDDHVAVNATSGNTTVNLGVGDDVINVGSAATTTTNTGGNLNAIQGALTINGEAGTNVANFDETGDATANNGTLTSTQLTGLGMGAAGATYADLANLNINLGTGGDTFNVRSTFTTTLTTLKTGTGTAANVVNVGSLAPATGGDVNAIAGKLVIDGQSSNDTINVDDTGDGAANAGTLTSTRLTGLGMGGDDVAKGIEYTNIETLNINLGGGADTFFIASTHVGLTVLSTGGGNDNVYVATLSGETRIRGQGGDDTIKVNVDSTGAERQIGGLTQNGVGALLDINGGEGSDHTIIYLAGAASSASHPVSLINVSDNGTVGNNTLEVYGTDIATVSDNFLIRRNFIALMPAVAPGGTPTAERINYDSTINGNGSLVSGVTIYGRAGSDYFAFDDNSTTMTIDGGAGADTFQVGQMFQSERVAPNVAGGDEVSTVHTTRGFLTKGVSYETTINGGDGNDTFTVFSNQGALHLFGDDGDDSFVVRAFALYGSQAADPARAGTNISAGLGADYVEYNVNAPVTVDGGDGTDKVVVVGTEFSDHFVITSTSVTGAGLTVSFVGIELLEIDGMEGNDRFTVLSTPAGVVTRIFGGLGSDVFEIGGEATTTSGRTAGNIGGPLILEGGIDPTADRSLANPLLYLNETNPNVHVNQPNPNLTAVEAQQVDSLWVYNNDVLTGQTGTLTNSLLSGLGMGAGATLSGIAYPSGITYLNLEMVSVYLGKGDDTFEIINTHGGTTLVDAGDGNDTINVRTVIGHTSVLGGAGNDNVILGAGASSLTIDRLRALVSIDGGGGSDTVTIDDRADTNNNVGTLDTSTLTGLDLLQAIVRTVDLSTALPGSLTFTIDGRTTGALAVSSSSTEIRTALLALGLPGVSDIVVNRAGSFFTFAFLVDETSASALAVTANASNVVVPGVASVPNRLQTISLPAASGTFAVNIAGGQSFNITVGDSDNTVRDAIIAKLPNTVSVKDVFVAKFGNTYEVMFQGLLAGNGGNPYTFSVAPRSTASAASFSINAVSGAFRLRLANGAITSPVAWNASAADVQTVLRGILGSSTLTVSRAGSTYNISGGGVALVSVDDSNLIAPIAVESRNSGVNYYGVDVLNLQLGSGSDVMNIRGTSAVTNVFGNDGDDRVYVSSLASETLTSKTDFLLGNLDRILGTLNLDLGTGRHVLMISDEAGIAGKGTTANPVNITDQPVAGLGLPPTEITITGLTAAPAITYKAAPTGNFADGITMWTGWGADTIVVSGTHQRGDGAVGSMRTITTLNTGLGDDNVTVNLNASDGFFVLNTQGPYNAYDGLLSDKDTVDASASTRPLVIFGGQDVDHIIGGQAGDIIFGDRGLVTYYSGTTVVAILGNGGPGDRTDGVERTVGRIETTFASIGGNDVIDALGGNNVVLGGQGGDQITTGAGSDVIVGDGGIVTYDAQGLLAMIQTDTSALGGSDTISAGAGNDYILGGVAGDTISGEAGDDVILGDNGRIEFSGGVITRAVTTDVTVGGADTINGGDGNDFILAGTAGDTVSAGAGNDVVLGDFGDLTFSNGVLMRAEPINRDLGGADTLRGDDGDDVLIGGAFGDRIDGGAGNDLILGDNGVIDRNGRLGNFTNPLFQTLSGAVIYDASGNPMVDNNARNQPGAAPAWGDFVLTLLDHTLALQTSGSNAFGNDYIAGGAGNDRIFGGLGNDTIQGDGSIDRAVSAVRDANGILQITGSIEAATDGDDYIEGNGGNDLIFGGLGQDDIIGGSSSLFGLTTPAMRPDGSDLIFGGAGTHTDREDAGDTSATGHARDADVIAGDNANIYRLVGINGVAGNAYLTFNYDNYSTALRIIPRAVRLLDYTPGGVDLNANAVNDIGAADEIHGESGDDTIYGQLGNDVLFGDGQDDDIIGGVGNDWISGGNGDDGILGDDGRIFTSRNGPAEPLYGIAAIANNDLNETISTPGQMQVEIINVAGELKKTAIVEPFMLTNSATKAGVTPSNDIVFGGLGSDSIHGGAGDDALSGAEALPEYFAKPFNPGDYLRFGKVRPGEFAAYNEYNPLAKVYVNPTTFEWVAQGTPGAVQFILNFVSAENDGDDVIFGDVGNDWIVGGVGRDHLYGGYGDDLLNADDNQDTNGGKNDVPDTGTNFEDLAFGGAGRDVLIANTGGDRLIDWAGEFNSYLVPFAPFGAATISRALQPGLMDFLYALSASDGADPTRAAKTGSSAARNGEPEGELGLVKQSDFDWQSQTGAPADPQPGNVPGGARDVLRSANFNAGTADGFSADTGSWQVTGGRLQVTPTVLGADAVSVFYVDQLLPRYYEVQATINAVKPTGGYKANAYLIFDYQSPTDFKFAGIDVGLDKLQIGHRTASGWVVDAQTNIQVRDGQDYNMLLSVNGTTVTIVVDNSSTNVLSFAFSPRVIDGYSYGLNTGMVGIGANNSRAQIDNVAVQVLPPQFTLQKTETFSNGAPTFLTGAQVGQWAVASSLYTGTPPAGGDFAVSNFDLGLSASSLLQFDFSVKVGANGTSAGIVFDYYDANNFKFAALVAGTNQVVIGHHTKAGWAIDATASRTVNAGTEYSVSVLMKGTTVSVTVGGQAVLGYVFNADVVDGQAGLFTRNGASSFSTYTVKTDDVKFKTASDSGGASVASLSAPVESSLLASDQGTADSSEAASMNQLSAKLTSREVYRTLGSEQTRFGLRNTSRFWGQN